MRRKQGAPRDLTSSQGVQCGLHDICTRKSSGACKARHHANSTEPSRRSSLEGLVRAQRFTRGAARPACTPVPHLQCSLGGTAAHKDPGERPMNSELPADPCLARRTRRALHGLRVKVRQLCPCQLERKASSGPRKVRLCAWHAEHG